MDSYFSKNIQLLTEYQRYKTRVVNIGGVPMGGNHPIRIQSMTNTPTMDTEATVAQTISLVDAGCDYVRITAPSVKEAHNLAVIKAELLARGYTVPLIADIHFVPRAAEVAARIVEKVRVNPGNYADRKRFEDLSYDHREYQAELDRIRERFTPLVLLCREEGTAMRIGANHGSLSDRILSHYGDTPLGMVESAMEFVRICSDNDFNDLVISMKASNTRIMIQAYRLLVEHMEREGFNYPLHLGVTEAGDGNDARIKSALGIGSLLKDGFGDTIRVSLTEAPEAEVPVAKQLLKYVDVKAQHAIRPIDALKINLFNYQRRDTHQTGILGGENVPRVISEVTASGKLLDASLKAAGYHFDLISKQWLAGDTGADILYWRDQLPAKNISSDAIHLCDAATWLKSKGTADHYPLFQLTEYLRTSEKHPRMNFVEIEAGSTHVLPGADDIIWIVRSDSRRPLAASRRFIHRLLEQGLEQPVILKYEQPQLSAEQYLLEASSDLGALFNDGLADGVWLSEAPLPPAEANDLAFGILQASRSRMTKTEYIACPSCGRTLFDLEEVTAQIRARTGHLKGLKIGIMGCIVNGPGEMADADFGYVGTGPGKVSLYRGQMVVRPHVPQEQAVDSLIDLIKSEGYWVDP